MRGYLLLIRLPYLVEALEQQIQALIAKLPQGSARVLYTSECIGFLVPYVDIPQVTVIKLRKELSEFSAHWLIGLDGTLVSSNGSMDPFRHWMNKFLGIEEGPKRPKTQHVPLTQRRKPRLKPPIHNFVDRTTGEMILPTAPDQDGAKKPD